MNMKLKSLVAAAVVTITMSGAASALTNNELFLVAYDSANAKTFIAALSGGVNGAGAVNTFTGASNLSYNFSGDGNWGSFIAPVTNSPSSITYQILGGFQSNSAAITSTNPGDVLLVSSNIAPGSYNNKAMNATMADFASSSGIWGTFDAQNALVTGTTTGFVAGTGPNSGANVSNNVFNTFSSITSTAGLGQDLGFWSFTRPNPIGNLLTQTVQNQFLQEGALTATNDVWNLGANGVLTYTGTTAVAAVPETNTWAMALLGLGFMGFVARRRA